MKYSTTHLLEGQGEVSGPVQDAPASGLPSLAQDSLFGPVGVFTVHLVPAKLAQQVLENEGIAR